MSKLDLLTSTQEIFIRSGRSEANKVPNQRHILVNTEGQTIFHVSQDRYIVRCPIIADNRPLTVFFHNTNLNVVMVVKKPPVCPFCWCFYLEHVKVYNFNGNIMGSVEQTLWKYGWVKLKIRDSTGNTLYVIKNQCCRSEKKYRLCVPEGGKTVGSIVKMADKTNVNMDAFKICFPQNADAHSRGLILGACYLIDVLY